MRRCGFALLLALVLTIGSGFAYAQPAEQAPCTAVLVAAFAPGAGVADEVHQVQAIAEALGVPFGQLAKALAGTHGTLEECIARIPAP